MNSAQPHSTLLTGRGLTAARMVWAVLVFGCLFVFVFGAVERFGQPLNEGCQIIECNPMDLSAEDLAILPSISASSSALAWAIVTVNLIWNLAYLGAAVLIVARRSNDWIALLVSFSLISLGTVAFSPANSILLTAQPQVVPLVDVLTTLGFISLLFLFLVFPDGRFIPRWTRWATPFLFLFVISERLLLTGLIMFLVYLVVSGYSQIYRYRRASDARGRQQTKWVAVGLASQLIVMGSWLFVSIQFPAEVPSAARTTTLLVLLPAAVILGSLFPICVTVAILRYRLWDVDIVINRTLVYGTLTGVLIMVYLASVVLLQILFRGLAGQESPLAIVASTLVIAALFSPLRSRIQAVIDRRLYRRKYNAARTLETFGEKVRDEVDLGELSGSLLELVEQSVQPERVTLWLKEK